MSQQVSQEPVPASSIDTIRQRAHDIQLRTRQRERAVFSVLAVAILLTVVVAAVGIVPRRINSEVAVGGGPTGETEAIVGPQATTGPDDRLPQPLTVGCHRAESTPVEPHIAVINLDGSTPLAMCERLLDEGALGVSPPAPVFTFCTNDQGFPEVLINAECVAFDLDQSG